MTHLRNGQGVQRDEGYSQDSEGVDQDPKHTKATAHSSAGSGEGSNVMALLRHLQSEPTACLEVQ